MMAALIRREKPSVVVEIGVFGGRSLVPQALALRENKQGVVYGIDPYTAAAATEGEFTSDPGGKGYWSVVAGTINTSGSFIFEAKKVGKETLLSQIIKMVEDAQGSKAPIEALADKISGIFVPIVLIIALVSLIVWLAVGSQFIVFSLTYLSFKTFLTISSLVSGPFFWIRFLITSLTTPDI
jgi:hypothetical protein